MIDFGSNEDFIKNYNELKSARKMSDLYNCSKGAVLNHAKKIGYDNSQNKEIKLPQEKLLEIIDNYEKLGSCKKVGEIYGCSATAVRNYLINNNYQPKNINDKLSNIKDEDFIADFNILKSTALMAEKYNCSKTSIINHSKKIGYNLNRNYKLNDIQKQEIIESYYTNTSTKLAKKYNVSRGMVTKLWHDANLLGKKVENIKTTEIDLTGKTFGKWTVLYKTDKRSSNGNIYWHCKCECGMEKDVNSASLRNGTSLSCGAHNNISKGNEKIKNILKNNNIIFEIEKCFSDCVDKKPLPFDFYVENKYLIEYDGIQHYDIKTKYDYEYTHRHDLIKSEWCKKNNIPLIRIPYTHFNNLKLEDLLLETSTFIEN